jgi:hypothetical protein
MHAIQLKGCQSGVLNDQSNVACICPLDNASLERSNLQIGRYVWRNRRSSSMETLAGKDDEFRTSSDFASQQADNATVSNSGRVPYSCPTSRQKPSNLDLCLMVDIISDRARLCRTEFFGLPTALSPALATSSWLIDEAVMRVICLSISSHLISNRSPSSTHLHCYQQQLVCGAPLLLLYAMPNGLERTPTSSSGNKLCFVPVVSIPSFRASRLIVHQVSSRKARRFTDPARQPYYPAAA